jgi:hypothetical protein
MRGDEPGDAGADDDRIEDRGAAVGRCVDVELRVVSRRRGDLPLRLSPIA